MRAVDTYTDEEILGHSNMSLWEFEAKRQGLPWPPAKVGPSRIERGPGSYKRRPARDYLAEPIDYLALPLHMIKET